MLTLPHEHTRPTRSLWLCKYNLIFLENKLSQKKTLNEKAIFSNWILKVRKKNFLKVEMLRFEFFVLFL